MKVYRLLVLALLLTLPLAGCSRATPTPQPATVTVTFDLANGGSGFSLVIYAQEVTTGKTYSLPYTSSSHGQVVLPTSGPLLFTVDAPGTYVFYGNLINAPEDYHYGATGCPPGPVCETTTLKALDVVPGGSYQVYFGGRLGEAHAPVPTPHAPLTVPWQR